MKAFLILMVVLPGLAVVWGSMPFEAKYVVRHFVRRNFLRVIVPIAALLVTVVVVSTMSFKLF